MKRVTNPDLIKMSHWYLFCCGINLHFKMSFPEKNKKTHFYSPKTVCSRAKLLIFSRCPIEVRSVSGIRFKLASGVRMKSGMQNANNQLLTCCASLCRAKSWPISVCAVGWARVTVSSARFSLLPLPGSFPSLRYLFCSFPHLCALLNFCFSVFSSFFCPFF